MTFLPEKSIILSHKAKPPRRPDDSMDMATSRQQPQPSPEPTAQMERRRSTREPIVTHGVIRPLNHDDAAGEQVLVTNVSLHGVGIRSSRAIPIGTRWMIEIGVGPLHLTSRLRVIRARVRNDGTYDVGGEFC